MDDLPLRYQFSGAEMLGKEVCAFIQPGLFQCLRQRGAIFEKRYSVLMELIKEGLRVEELWLVKGALYVKHSNIPSHLGSLDMILEKCVNTSSQTPRVYIGIS